MIELFIRRPILTWMLILSLVVWGTIWGVTGMFLCVPIMVILMIVFSNFRQLRPIAVLMSSDGRLRHQ